MKDYLEHLKWYLESRFDCQADIQPYENPYLSVDKKYTIIIFVQRIVPQIKAKLSSTQKVVLLNTEQMTLTDQKEHIIGSARRCNIPVIDYSLENIYLLKQRYPTGTFIHFPFPPRFSSDPPVKKYPAISLKSSTHRRQTCAKIKAPIVDFLGKWGKQRDSLIEQSKVLLNLHFKPKDYNIFESVRCYHALEMRTIVISEPSLDADKILLKDYIIFTPAQNMGNTLREVLEDYDTYYNSFFSEKRIQEINNRYEQIYRKSLDELMAVTFKN